MIRELALPSRSIRTGTRPLCSGFTIVELLIALVVSMVLIGTLYSIYTLYQSQLSRQQLVLAAQQNLRSALMIILQELRMAGFDPEDSGGFGLRDIRRYDICNKGVLNPNGQPVLFYSYDKNEDGILDISAGGHNGEQPRFMISDIYGDGRSCLTWDNGGGRHPLAENIKAIGFAYALDIDGDGFADRIDGGVNLIWAVDSDNDNLLDTNIDTNGDGLINEKDDSNGDGRIDMADGGELPAKFSLDRVKAVRVWVMAVTAKPVQGSVGRDSLAVGDRIVKPTADGLKRLVLETQVLCRNL